MASFPGPYRWQFSSSAIKWKACTLHRRTRQYKRIWKRLKNLYCSIFKTQSKRNIFGTMICDHTYSCFGQNEASHKHQMRRRAEVFRFILKVWDVSSRKYLHHIGRCILPGCSHGNCHQCLVLGILCRNDQRMNNLCCLNHTQTSQTLRWRQLGQRNPEIVKLSWHTLQTRVKIIKML